MDITGSSFTLRKNAKRAAEAMISKGTAPAVDYGIKPGAIVASRHDLRLRTITRVPHGHSFFGADSLNAGTGSVVAGAGSGAASIGDAAAGRSTEALAISVSTSSVIGAVLAVFQTISNRPSSLAR